jgi:uncharacterized protein YndB with AHSA1/START domain
MTTRPMSTGRTAMSTSADGREITIERTFDAPRERVFAAFSDRAALTRWWGPTGWTLSVCEVDFRPGGSWFYCMAGEGPDGAAIEACGRADYLEIASPERIVMEDAFANRDGSVNEALPRTHSTFLFLDAGGRTTLHNVSRYDSAEALQEVLAMGMAEGITQTFDRLEELLAEGAAASA